MKQISRLRLGLLKGVLGLVVCALALPVMAFDYQLKAQQLLPDIWMVEGKRENFAVENGGDIVNTLFLKTADGVLVIDTGVSLQYGRALRRLAEETAGAPVVYVINTHHHPDHFLGNQAFDDLPIAALPKTTALIKSQGDAFAENMYRMVGNAMLGTEVRVPDRALELGTQVFGGVTLELLAFSGHSGADLAVWLPEQHLMIASDLVFHDRALTTPHTPSLSVWRAQLEVLDQFPYQLLVPGHGPVSRKGEAVTQTIDYLNWLDETLNMGAKAGLSMTEMINLPLPERFAQIALRRMEWQRTVAHLYPSYEARWF